MVGGRLASAGRAADPATAVARPGTGPGAERRDAGSDPAQRFTDDCRQEEPMDAGEVSSKIKKIIGSIAGIDPQKIGDDATLRGELSLDSLSLLEIGVDVDLAFQLNLPDESYKDVDSVQQMVALVMRRQAEADPGAVHAAGDDGPGVRLAAVAG
jgi:acyl carrier protein